nr:S26 family signal peptidase [Clostridium perfringens]
MTVIINKFLLYKIVVPSSSMFPTVEVGNQLFVTKVYNTLNIKRGDILVFNSDELHELLLKTSNRSIWRAC